MSFRICASAAFWLPRLRMEPAATATIAKSEMMMAMTTRISTRVKPASRWQPPRPGFGFMGLPVADVIVGLHLGLRVIFPVQTRGVDVGSFRVAHPGLRALPLVRPVD